MEQQNTNLPLEWLSSRRTPELHRLEQLCRAAAREQRCAQRRLQEVEEAMASRPEELRPYTAPGRENARLEQMSRKLNAANAELRRYETRMFAYERTMVALRKENAELAARCQELHREVEALADSLLQQKAPLPAALPPLPEIRFPGQEAPAPAEPDPKAPAPAPQPARTQLEDLSQQVLAQLDRLMPRQET